MDAKTLLLEEIEREYKHLKEQTVGSEEYNKSMDRLNTLVDKYTSLTQVEDEKADRFKKNIIEIVKFAIGSVIIPVSMSLIILKFEETGSITTALRTWLTGTASRKMI